VRNKSGRAKHCRTPKAKKPEETKAAEQSTAALQKVDGYVAAVQHVFGEGVRILDRFGVPSRCESAKVEESHQVKTGGVTLSVSLSATAHTQSGHRARIEVEADVLGNKQPILEIFDGKKG
jgi:hypothetical protein